MSFFVSVSVSVSTSIPTEMVAYYLIGWCSLAICVVVLWSLCVCASMLPWQSCVASWLASVCVCELVVSVSCVRSVVVLLHVCVVVHLLRVNVAGVVSLPARVGV